MSHGIFLSADQPPISRLAMSNLLGNDS